MSAGRHMWTARDGLAVRLQVFSDRRAAREAFGADGGLKR